MEDGVVRRRRWLDRERFLDLLSATDRIPGANSTALAIHVGYGRGGFPGLVVAGSCFILSARLIVLAPPWPTAASAGFPSSSGCSTASSR
jgi:chromate transporter